MAKETSTKLKVGPKTKRLRLQLLHSPLAVSRRRSCFLCFIRRFWNQVLTCVSLKPSAVASSTRSGVDKYRCASKRFSSPESCGSLKTVRALRRRQCLRAFTPMPKPRASSGTQPGAPKKGAPPNRLAAKSGCHTLIELHADIESTFGTFGCR